MTHKHNKRSQTKTPTTMDTLLRLYDRGAKEYPYLFDQVTHYPHNRGERWYTADYRGVKLDCSLEYKTGDIINNLRYLQNEEPTGKRKEILTAVSNWLKQITDKARVYLVPIADEYTGDPGEGGRFLIVYNERARFLFPYLPEYNFTNPHNPLAYKDSFGNTKSLGLDITEALLKTGKETILTKRKHDFLLGTLTTAFTFSAIDRRNNLNKIKELFYNVHFGDYLGEHLTDVYGTAIIDMTSEVLKEEPLKGAENITAPGGYLSYKQTYDDGLYDVIKTDINEPFTDFGRLVLTFVNNPWFDTEATFEAAI